MTNLIETLQQLNEFKGDTVSSCVTLILPESYQCV